MTCKKCGYENSLDTDICPKCGHKYKRIGKSSKYTTKNHGGKAGKDSKNDKLVIALYIIGIVLAVIFLSLLTFVITNYKSSDNKAPADDTMFVAVDSTDEVSETAETVATDTETDEPETTVWDTETTGAQSSTSTTAAKQTTRAYTTTKSYSTTKAYTTTAASVTTKHRPTTEPTPATNPEPVTETDPVTVTHPVTETQLVTDPDPVTDPEPVTDPYIDPDIDID